MLNGLGRRVESAVRQSRPTSCPIASNSYAAGAGMRDGQADAEDALGLSLG